MKTVTININNTDYITSSPTSEEYTNRIISSFGDEIEDLLPKIRVNWNHYDGFSLSLFSENPSEEYLMKVYDNDNVLLYETKMFNNMFCSLNRKYFNGIRYEIFKGNILLLTETVNFKDKRVFISIDSSSLGDSIAWIPYCEEFRKKHNCILVVSTFFNYLFEDVYPDIEFIKPGEPFKNIHAIFKLGWYYDNTREPVLPNTLPLQKTPTNILGLDFKEIKPKIKFLPSERPISEKYITIATHSTAGCKLWDYSGGWQILINYLNDLGYKVAVIQKEPIDNLQNVLDWTGDYSLNERMNQIHHSEFFIGLSSGLSWVSWALNKKVVMISNFTHDYHEFSSDIVRITNTSVCHGCWNNPNFKFDRADWYWCPIYKNTEKHFECHKSITPSMVIEKIKDLL